MEEKEGRERNALAQENEYFSFPTNIKDSDEW